MAQMQACTTNKKLKLLRILQRKDEIQMFTSCLRNEFVDIKIWEIQLKQNNKKQPSK